MHNGETRLLNTTGSIGEPVSAVIRYSVSSSVRDTQATVEIVASGSGTLLLDFVSLMRADVRRDGVLRPDLLEACAISLRPLSAGRAARSLPHTSGRTGSARTFRDHTTRIQCGRLLGLLEISTIRPEDWTPGTVDAIATRSADSRRIVIKAVNYGVERNALLVRLQGAGAPETATMRLHTISAGLKDVATLENPNAIGPATGSLVYAKDFTVDLNPHEVAVIEIVAGSK